MKSKVIITLFIIGYTGVIVLLIAFGLQNNADVSKFYDENEVKRIILAKVPFNELKNFYQMYKSDGLSQSEMLRIKGVLQDALSEEEYEKVKRYVMKLTTII